MYIVFSFSHRYSRVLRGDLATEHRTKWCERRRQEGCVGGNFPFSRYRLEKICTMFTLYLVSHMQPNVVSLPVSHARLRRENIVMSHGCWSDCNTVSECQAGGS